MFEADFARYRGATVASVKAVVNEYLNTRNRLIVRFQAGAVGRAVRPPRSIAPKSRRSVPIGRSRRPTVKSSKLPNGLEVFVVERPELPKVSVALATRAGGHRRPGRQGRARAA